MLASWGGLIVRRLYQFYSDGIACGMVAFLIAMLNLQGFLNSIIFMAVSMCNESD